MTRPSVRGPVSAAALIAALLCAGVALAAEPGPTPTPRPKLSGGFGKPRTSPPPSSAAGASEPARAGAARPERAAVTINNQTLVTDPQKGRLSTSNAPPATPPPTASRTYTAEAPLGGAPSAGGPAPAALEEAKWRAAAKSARERVQAAKGEVERLTAEAAKLESDFYAWDDGQYRDNVIKPAWDKTKQDLEAAKAELAAAEKDLADLPEKARKAGALPGWLRE